ncbi:MAG TPA: SCP2 sterol-binding domain-containing protein [Acidimicrobiales bacterium]|nr:SCP2 sterol-binding domain-containing protein [Acidimicrobiales bacterium]
MAEFLSEAWIAELDAVGRAAEVPGDLRVVVQQVVVDDDGSEVAYAVRIADGAVRVEPGRVPDADVRFTQPRDVAAAIARGELSAQTAFLAGDLRVGGDLAAVREGSRALAALSDVFGPARAATTW